MVISSYLIFYVTRSLMFVYLQKWYHVIHSFKKYALSTYHLPGILGTEDTHRLPSFSNMEEVQIRPLEIAGIY